MPMSKILKDCNSKNNNIKKMSFGNKIIQRKFGTKSKKENNNIKKMSFGNKIIQRKFGTKKEKVNFIRESITKTQCLGFTKKGTRCSRLLLGNTTQCFQHSKGLEHALTCTKKMKALDQFYTSKENTTICIELYSKFISINRNNDVIIEPSAGNGSFINSIDKLSNNIILIDIDPKHSRIEVGDFLNFNKNLNKFKKVHVIGNPPFSVVHKFIKKACKIADSIGFILPLSFRKVSRKKAFPLNFHLVHEYIILSNIFYFNGCDRKVPTAFQI
jgi:hypothetical protein